MIPGIAHLSVRTTQIDPRHTYDLDAAPRITSGLNLPHGFIDAILACLDYLVGIMLVPPIISLHPSTCYGEVWDVLTLVQGNTEEIRSDAGLRCWRGYRRL